MKILIADDDLFSRRLLEKTLRRAGYEVVAVSDGHRAIELLNQPDSPRLALLDWMMPTPDGPEVCRRLRQRRDQPYIYTLLLTSKQSKKDIVAGLQAGADDYLVKPFDVEELKARLRTGERILDLEDRLVKAREQMRFKATHDPLTALWNRGVIMDLLSRELARSTRENSCTAILLIDIDHFKAVNDTFGHTVGDKVLQEVARRLLSSVRSYDFVGRFGGEEFLIVLNNCEPRFASVRAEEIRKTVAGHPIQTAQGNVRTSISIGLLFSRDWPLCGAEDLLHKVDLALYAAKSAGRDCIRVAKPDQEPVQPSAALHEPSVT